MKSRLGRRFLSPSDSKIALDLGQQKLSLFTPASEPVRNTVRQNSRPTRVYWLMNALATIIACYGLFTNSPAVVIGSMVVALMLDPIAGVALGLNEGDRTLLRTAMLALVGGVAWIIAIAIGIGLIHQDVPLSSEIMSRTKPGLFDLIIALAGGAAGAVAVLSPRVGTAIVGVAVATALVPPFAAVGILLARADFNLAAGALLLGLTNIAAIQVAFSVVFWIGGYRQITAGGKRGVLMFFRHDGLSVAIICLLAAVLGLQFHSTINGALFEGRVRAVLRQRLNDPSGSHLADVRFTRDHSATVVTAVVRGTKAPSTQKVAGVEMALPRPPDDSVLELRVRFIEVAIVTPRGPGIDDGDE